MTHSDDARRENEALRARISTLNAAILRINASLDLDTVLGTLAIDYDRRRVTVGGDTVALTATEYELLRVLSIHTGRVMTYSTLPGRVWSGRNNADADLVRIFVRNLRRKLGDSAASPARIFNERGVGYRMAQPGEERGPCAGHGPES